MPTLEQLPDEPLWRECNPGTELYRVVPCDGHPLWFNPNDKANPADANQGGRFHPLESVDGTRIPTLYIASNLEAAIAETLLHHLPEVPPSKPYYLEMQLVRKQRFVKFRVTNPIKLVDLEGAGADRIRMPCERVCWCSRAGYPTSRQAASLLHKRYQEAHGIRWTSRRYPPATCLLIFGDRLRSPEQVLAIEQPALRELHAPGCEGYPTLERALVEAGVTPIA